MLSSFYLSVFVCTNLLLMAISYVDIYWLYVISSNFILFVGVVELVSYSIIGVYLIGYYFILVFDDFQLCPICGHTHFIFWVYC
jgi:hypothetical protein